MHHPNQTPRDHWKPEQFASIEEALATMNQTISRIHEENFNFLSIIFHDLRNPLTYIKMSVDVLLTGSFGELPDEQKSVLEKSVQQIDRLNKMIDDVLLVAKLENNKLPFSFASGSITQVLREALANNQSLLEQKNLTLQANIPDSIPPMAMDYKHMSVALNYLVNYCVKSTQEGGLTVACKMDSDRISIDLVDTSETIQKENVPHIFEKLKCFGMMAKNKEARSGLELAICKEIIKKHNGTIHFDTDETHGNQFTVEFPLNEKA